MAAESSKKSTSLVIDYREGHNQSHLLQNLKTAFDKQLHTDFTLITSADDQKIRCHKLVLIMCSKFFEQLFTVRNYNEPQLTLPFVKGPMLKSLIYFMYHQQLKVDADGLHLTMDWASILWIHGLKTPSATESERDQTARLIFLEALYADLDAVNVPTKAQISSPNVPKIEKAAPKVSLPREDLTPPESPADQPIKGNGNREEGYKKYSDKEMTMALESVTGKGVEPKDAAKNFKIPVRTLYHYLNKSGYSGSVPMQRARKRRKNTSQSTPECSTSESQRSESSCSSNRVEPESPPAHHDVVEIKQEIEEESEDDYEFWEF